MEITVLKSAGELADKVAAEIEAVLRSKPDALICLCGGESPIPVMKKLVDDAKKGLYPSDRFKFISLDEWVGLGIEDAGSCIYDVTKNFLSPLGIEKGERLFFFDGLSAGLQGECERAEAFIKANGGIDLIMLGIGMNGHIGFNEPGSAVTDGVRVVELSDVSKTVGAKYFDRPRRLDRGITLGLKQIMSAGKIVVIAYGEHKKDIVYETAKGKISNSCPSTLIRNHPDASLFVDSDAAVKIGG